MNHYKLPMLLAFVFAAFSVLHSPDAIWAQKTESGQKVTTPAAETPAKAASDNPTQENKTGDQAETSADDSFPEGKWVQLFNGKDLTGWTPKIRGHEFGDNYADTFRVNEEGSLVVSYDDYKPDDFLSMDDKKKPNWEKFGHLFYERPFSHYILRAEYRFIGTQVANGPGWAFRNNGFMIHGQDPTKMAKMQKFPVSIEVQLLGGGGKGDRPTANLCTPGTNVVMGGKLFKSHCTKSKSPTFHGDQWVTVEIEVRGNKVIRHKIGGETVLEYTEPQYDQRDAEARQFIVDGNLKISSGTISIQSESHPTEFRKIELMRLSEDAE